MPNDLEARVEARKRELIAELIEHKKSLRSGAADAIVQLRGRLTELTQITNENPAGGRAARDALEAWIAR